MTQKARNPINTSLFGHDLHTSKQYTAHIRLAVIPTDPQMSNIQTAYDTFLSA